MIIKKYMATFFILLSIIGIILLGMWKVKLDKKYWRLEYGAGWHESPTQLWRWDFNKWREIFK